MHRTLPLSVVALLGSVTCAAVETVRLPAVRDTSIVLVDGEEAERQGGLARIRIKGNQHIVAMGFDAAALAGRAVVGAELVCRRVDADIRAVTIATISAPW
ncbi:MAG: hypothetical protein H0W83_12980, partial [Planctomycetes bacterium]|nr:hypothetical protein [Planctomycetota bacterium]